MARYKIKLSFFLGLNNIVGEYIETLKPKLWNGFRLIAGDGTTVNLPPSSSVKNHFGIFRENKSGTKTCMANACILYDVLSNFTLDSIISPISIGEGSLMNNMLLKHKWANSIILLDRGFGYFSTCKILLSRGSGFCIRLKTSQSDFAKKALLNPFNDFITEWIASEAEKVTCKKNKLDHHSIKVRVTKVLLNTGEIELLVSTLLDMAQISEKAIQELYNLRWGVEEGFKKLKPKMKLEQFGCRRYEGIYQEFYAHIFMMNLVEIVAADAEEIIITKTKNRKLKYKYNWQNAFRFLRDKFIDIFHLGEFINSLQDIVEKIANSLIAVKDKRTFPRNQDRDKSRNTQCYK
jgi:hypothetical protein